ncbi:AAA family ATPase [Treponema sp. OMZ 788]|uniref:AAA family ATPase n=1 Tax=Treponema sp. OMZ 788 TaxID=2563664 RepID=UPI0020A4E65A|nr:AAA family ATPase [Treponema sp. OMZ 788]UTC63745.1 AAA family ATPase [Treponema sp. OMZ 788]
MNYTKEEVIEKINKSFYELKEKIPEGDILINRVIENAGFKGEEKNEILELFSVNKYAELLQTLEKFEVYTPTGKTDKAVREKKSEENIHTAADGEKPMEDLHKRMEILLKFLNSGLYEKEEAVRLALLSIIAGENIFLLGPPGVAKSMIARKLTHILKEDSNGKSAYFEYLLNEFSTPDELFGAVSLKALENDDYKRNSEGFLPKAVIAFLDEIWKAGPAILNTLLSITNEKKFHNGKTVESVPLKGLLAASNELPAKGKGLEALWDRFVVRILVEPIHSENSFFTMITSSSADTDEAAFDETVKAQCISEEELKELRQLIDLVEVPESVKSIISAIRKELIHKNADTQRADEEKYYISDRRWKRIIRLLRTCALLNGRNFVDIMDASLIADCIWSTEKQKEEVTKIVQKLIGEYGLECNTAVDDINDQIKAFDNKISQTWYEKKETIAQKAGPIIVKEPDSNDEYYEVKDDDGNMYYFAVNRYDGNYGDRHYYYNTNWNSRRIAERVSISEDQKTITSNYGIFTIQWTEEIKGKSKLQKNKVLFDTLAVYTATKEKFDKEDYQPIADSIKEEKEKLAAYKTEQEIPFKANLFADPEIADIIFAKIDSAMEELEDAQVVLDKAQNRYTK